MLKLCRTLPMVHIRRMMGDNDEYNPVCNLYMSVADYKNNRLAYMWSNTLGDPVKGKPGPEFTMIHIPDEHRLRQQVPTRKATRIRHLRVVSSSGRTYPDAGACRRRPSHQRREEQRCDFPVTRLIRTICER